jgi:hypothetical protein
VITRYEPITGASLLGIITTRKAPDVTEDEAVRGLPTCPATYLLRDGALVCTTCGAVVGGTDSDQIRHSTWHTALAALFAVADAHRRPAV